MTFNFKCEEDKISKLRKKVKNEQELEEMLFFNTDRRLDDLALLSKPREAEARTRVPG